jgi:hypothetical protein
MPENMTGSCGCQRNCVNEEARNAGPERKRDAALKYHLRYDAQLPPHLPHINVVDIAAAHNQIPARRLDQPEQRNKQSALAAAGAADNADFGGMRQFERNIIESQWQRRCVFQANVFELNVSG